METLNHSDLDILIADKWQIEFNFKKCKVIFIGKNKRDVSYEKKEWLDAVKEEKTKECFPLRYIRENKIFTEINNLNKRNKTSGNRWIKYKKYYYLFMNK